MLPSGRNYQIDRRTRRLRIEALEDRRMLATFNVTNLLDGPVTAAGDLPGSLRQAIFDANNTAGADEITFSVNGTIAIGSQLPTITNDLTITGPGMDLLTIDAGNGTDGDFATGDGYRIFNVEDGNDATFLKVELSGLTLTGGDVAAGIDDGGGAIRSFENLTINNSTISGNSVSELPGAEDRTEAESGGGGIFSSGGDLTINDSEISGNASQSEGYFTCIEDYGTGFDYTVLKDLPLGRGGGISFSNGDLTITGSTISGNSAKQYAGGVYLENADATISTSVISDNHVNGYYYIYGPFTFGFGEQGNGGGIATSQSQLTISSSVIENNTAVDFGGAIWGDATILDSLISGNSASIAGALYRGGFTISNSTVSGNTSSAGTVILSNSLTTVTNSTIAFNGYGPSGSLPSGIYAIDLVVRNSIITSVDSDSSPSISYSVLQDPGTKVIVGTGNIIGVDPLLAPLQDNGGLTFTHALLPSSPAIDAGDPAFTAPPDHDQRGEPFERVSDGRIDIGAYESQPLQADYNGDGTVDGRDLLWIQRNGGNYAQWEAEYGLSTPQEAQSLVVTTEQDIVNPVDGLTSLREAIEYANSLPGADEITFSSLFDSAQTIAIGSQLPTITDHLTITGPGMDLLTIDAGDGTDGDFATGDGYRIFNIDDGDNATFLDVEISGLTLTGGDIEGGEGDGGGAIRNSENLTIIASTISDNATTEFYAGGGGIYSRIGSLAIEESAVSYNSTLGWLAGGGGIFVAGGELSVHDSTISGNKTKGLGSHGAGIGTNDADAVIDGSTFSNNNAYGYEGSGGGIGISGGTFTISSSLFSNNHVSGMGSSLGGFIFGNASGGGIALLGTTTTGLIVNTTVSGNTASASSGGIRVGLNDLTIQSSTIAYNNSGVGASNSSTLTIENSIIAKNDSFDLSTGSEPTGTSVNYSILGVLGSAVYSGTNNINNVDPLFTPLQDNGGPTFTHALLPGSPAIDMGNPAFAAPPDFDQRGAAFDRVHNGRIDIGAYESQPLQADHNGDKQVDGKDFLWIQRNGGDFAQWEAEYGLSELQERQSLVVNTTLDVVDAYDGLTSLREAIHYANSKPGTDTITFSSIFNFAQTISIGSQLPTIISDLTITGPGQSLLTIDAGNGTDNVPGTGDGYRIFNVEDGNDATFLDVEISGLTLTRGDLAEAGGAISSSENLTVIGSTITGNSTVRLGASGQQHGGGINSRVGHLIIQNSTVSSNSAEGFFGGGGVFANTGQLTVSDSAITGNQVSYYFGAIGGGIGTRDADLIVNNSTISGNVTDSGSGSGAGIGVTGGSLSMTGSTVSANEARGLRIQSSQYFGVPGGGIYLGSAAAATIENSTITGNRSTGEGGGIFSRADSNLILLSSTVAFNYAGIGVYSSAGVFYYLDSSGGGVAHAGLGTITIQNSILAQNEAPGSNNNRIDFGALVSAGIDYSLIQEPGTSNFTGTGNIIGVDPLLGPLQNNGGPTETHELLAGSQAIDAGTPGLAGTLADQRGVPFDRVSDGRIDMGAFEVQGTPPLTLTVTTELDVADPGDGLVSLREAIDYANLRPGADTIAFSTHFDTARVMLLQSQLPAITKDLVINGPGAALLTIDAGDGADNQFATGDGFRIFEVNDGDELNFIDVELQGMTLTGGDVVASNSDGGGTVRNFENLTISGVTISDSAVSGMPGASTADEAHVSGGGILSRDGTLTIHDSTISGNSAKGTSYFAGYTYYSAYIRSENPRGRGGGIAFNGNTLTITDSTISGNLANERAGGISLGFADAYISGSVISDNVARGWFYYSGGPSRSGVSYGYKGFAGGIYGSNSQITLSSSVLENNSAADWAGGISGSATIEDSLITGNSADRGGALSGVFTISNSTVSGNTSTGEGAVIRSGSLVTVRNSTIVNNSAAGATGGIDAEDLTVSNSIVALNSGADITVDDDLDVTYSLIHDPGTEVITGAGTFTGVDPLLGPLQDNGGPTFTHALLPGSPAIDAGDPAFTAPPDFDQRGAPFDRVYNGRIDIGAYESQPLQADYNGDGTVDGKDLLWIQRNGGDFAQWEAEYGLQEITQSSVVATVASEEAAPIIFCASLPEAIDPSRVEEQPVEPMLSESYDQAFENYEPAESSLDENYAFRDLASADEEEETLWDDEEHLSSLIGANSISED